MSGGDYFYEGANYGFDPEYGGVSSTYSANPAASIGLSTDPRTANQLKETSSKLNTGATAVEVSLVSSDVFESIPKEHFKELNRLRKLVGGNVELTLHAPITEPTGLTKKGWDPYEREQAERQMFGAIEKAHDMNPAGNVVTTFHASAVSLPGEVKIWEKQKVGGEEKLVPVVKEVYIIDERSGEIGKLPMKPSYFEGEEGKQADPAKELKKLNQGNWYKGLQHLNYLADHGASMIDETFKKADVNAPLKKGLPNPKEKLLGFYKDYAEGRIDKMDKELKEVELKNPEAGPLSDMVKADVQSMLHGDLYLRDAYNGLRDLFDQAYFALKQSDSPEAKEKLEKLDEFKNRITPKLDYLKTPEKVDELAKEVRSGIHLLRSIEAPEIFKPFKQFAIDKSSDTFSDIALKSYNKFGDSSPIISIENPPAGAGVIYSGEDLRLLVEKSRDKFGKALEKTGMSKESAENEAKKIIGATWDVGHINMLRKYGAGKEELIKETKAIAPVVKHVHLSDNFGMEHTELPMGMGNVPTKEMMQAVEEHNKKFKKIMEVGNWYQHFQTTPFGETLQHFGSPIYAMNNASYWGPQGGYFAGYGMNPEIHHAVYGAGFSNLPVELGGQMSGRSRVSGTPLE